MFCIVFLNIFFSAYIIFIESAKLILNDSNLVIESGKVKVLYKFNLIVTLNQIVNLVIKV